MFDKRAGFLYNVEKRVRSDITSETSDDEKENTVDKYIKISGMQKLTLLDYPEHTACTLFVPGCNFRCPFCHNSELLGGDVEFYDEAEVFAFLRKRVGVLEGVCVTGGEPTVYTDLDRLLGKIKELGYLVKLDTNGYRPDRLEKLVGSGLVDYIAMDIKNSPERYAETIGLPDTFDIAPIERSIDIIMNGGMDYEFRTTVSAELFDDKSIEGAARMIIGAKKYFLQKFIMRDTVPSKTLTSPQDIVLSRYLDIVRRFVPNAAIRGL